MPHIPIEHLALALEIFQRHGGTKIESVVFSSHGRYFETLCRKSA